MQMIKRAVLAFTFILALLATTVSADVFQDEPIPNGTNKGFVITECGKVIMVGLAIFAGPDDVKGKMMIATRPPGASEDAADYKMNQYIAEAVELFKADGDVFELADLTDRFCA
jgi:hypothetical protein